MSILKTFFTDKSRLKGQKRKKSHELIIFFADISGSTRMHELLGDSMAHECIMESLGSIAKLVKANQGMTVQVIGDEIMAWFEHSLDAVNCACSIQKHFCFSNTSCGQKVRVHIGFCRGRAELDQGKPYGDTVNVAARLTSLARAGQIVTTRKTLEDLSEEKRTLCRPLPRARVKGKSKPLDTVEILWNQEDATAIFTVPMTHDRPMSSAQVVLTFENQKIVVKEKDTPFIFGRGPDSHILVASETASRSHARIESRYDELVFVDHSTNGSYINTIPGSHAYDGMDIHLHHRDWTMVGQGSISLGRPFSDNDPHAILFSAGNRS
ncbi:adenylate/guanylate cyclase domain-containing protein [Desulfospira joergensenii]|uniref:adenylate/guanylate cyclase domain-containing protein n=1 Tax=Desulfospira joergensenii TaxID=53329 RepID=UPI0003B36731|nr:adenylate/guanylate cyclase domain-containing protein [Desulfospira joergensenii]